MQGLGPVDGQKHFPFTRLPRGVQFTPRLVQLFEAFEHTRLLLTLERVLEWESCVDSSRDLLFRTNLIFSLPATSLPKDG